MCSVAESDSSGDNGPVSQELTRAEGHVNRARRTALTGHDGRTVWLTGLSGSGKSTLAFAVEDALVARGVAAYVKHTLILRPYPIRLGPHCRLDSRCLSIGTQLQIL